MIESSAESNIFFKKSKVTNHESELVEDVSWLRMNVCWTFYTPIALPANTINKH